MGTRLAANNYGKSRVRLLRVTRRDDHHEIKDATLSIQFTGDFEAAHAAGDNRKILPTDTMKNTVYALAKQYPSEAIEELALHLTEHFLTYNPPVSRVEVAASERPWSRITLGDRPHPSAFTRSAVERRTARVAGTRQETTVWAGIEDLIVLKTAQSGFEGFFRDPYTTLAETRDRILSTAIHAEWTYRSTEAPFSAIWQGVRRSLLETFAAHDSRSLQHTLHAMGSVILENFEAIQNIRLSLPNHHYLLVDLKPFGMENNSEVFLPIDEPHGLIEATLRREP